MWYYVCLYIARFVFWCLGCRVRGVGKENVPKKGPLIVAPLHVSHFDPPAVACGTQRRLRFMAKEELFHHKFFGALIRSLGAFPVKRGEGDTESIRNAISYINSGEAVLIFPEGTRGDGKHIQPLNRGVAMIAKRTGAPVMPVGVIGSHIAWPRGQKKPKRHHITIAYGAPFTYGQVASAPTEKENRELFAMELQKRIAALCSANGLDLKIEPYTEPNRRSDAPERSSAEPTPG